MGGAKRRRGGSLPSRAGSVAAPPAAALGPADRAGAGSRPGQGSRERVSSEAPHSSLRCADWAGRWSRSLPVWQVERGALAKGGWFKIIGRGAQ